MTQGFSWSRWNHCGRWKDNRMVSAIMQERVLRLWITSWIQHDIRDSNVVQTINSIAYTFRYWNDSLASVPFLVRYFCCRSCSNKRPGPISRNRPSSLQSAPYSDRSCSLTEEAGGESCKSPSSRISDCLMSQQVVLRPRLDTVLTCRSKESMELVQGSLRIRFT